MPISPANSVTSSKPTWTVYDQFSFDPVAEMRQPNKELQLRRAEGPRQGGASRLLSSEIFSPDVPEPSEDLQDLGRYSYFYSNHRGDITSLLKHDGQSLHSYVYEEYGSFYDTNQSKGESSNFIDPHNHYTFSAKEFDNETGLMYYGARYLDLWNGTWVTQDIYRGQIDLPASLHRYGFVENNPINNLDKDGYCLGPFTEYCAQIFTAAVLKKPVELYNVSNVISIQQTSNGNVSQQTSGNITLDFSKTKSTLTGNFDATQKYVPKSGVGTLQFGKGEGGIEIFGPAIGGQITGATVQGNQATQLINKRYTSGGGEKFLTPSAKFALDKQRALVESRKREKDLKEREQRQLFVERLIQQSTLELEAATDAFEQEKIARRETTVCSLFFIICSENYSFGIGVVEKQQGHNRWVIEQRLKLLEENAVQFTQALNEKLAVEIESIAQKNYFTIEEKQKRIERLLGEFGAISFPERWKALEKKVGTNIASFNKKEQQLAEAEERYAKMVETAGWLALGTVFATDIVGFVYDDPAGIYIQQKLSVYSERVRSRISTQRLTLPQFTQRPIQPQASQIKFGPGAMNVGELKINNLLSKGQIISESKELIQISRSGGFQTANKTFDDLAKSYRVTPKTIQRPEGIVRTIDIPTGGSASVRPFSSGEQPTIQVNIPGQKIIKIRFND